jgi:omega-6 fatty acid desaturase (delta-12 desaturase)
MQLAARSDREVLEATKAFCAERPLSSWWHLLSGLAALGLGLSVAALHIAWPARLAVSLLSGLVIVRLFIVYHDYLHGAILRGSRIAPWIMYPLGVLVMTPPRVWRETHNYHHNHTAKLVGSNIGSFATMTTQQWREATARQRVHYWLVRHPVTVLFGYFTIFMLDMCLMSFVRSPRRRWDSLVALLANWALTAWIVTQFGFATWVFVHFVPLFTASAVGGYLFYAQHNFLDMHIQPREDWCYVRAALESSSYMETGPVLGWFTGNIGYHHVHHLNPTIPFYRLPEAMEAIPELQNPGRTSLGPREIAHCFALKLWDPEQGRMVGYPEA